MSFQQTQNLITQYAHDNDINEAMAVDDLIEQNKIIEQLTYPVFIQLTCDFLTLTFQQLNLANLDDLQQDLTVSQKFLSQKITAKQLENHRVIALKRHAKLDGQLQHAQKLTINLLFKELLLNLDDPTAQCSYAFVICDDLNCLEDGLESQFYWFLLQHLPK